MKTIAAGQPTSAIRVLDSRINSRETREIRKIEESIGYMMRHLDRPLRVSTLATEVHISLSHFFYLFKRHVGRTPIDFFIRLRLQRACRLLEETEMSVKAIAYTLGYDDPFYFSRIFKSVNRISPSQYRSRKRADGKNNSGLLTDSLLSRTVPAGRGFQRTAILVRQPARRCS
jgi:transcriptional regulator GlxA family with amidase domain